MNTAAYLVPIPLFWRSVREYNVPTKRWGWLIGMRWIISVRYMLVVMSVVIGAVVAVVLARSCNTLLSGMDTEDVLTSSHPLEECVSFPYEVNGTGLIALSLISYEGTFLEDGGDSEVADVAALLLRNNTDQYVYEGQIMLKQGDNVLEFHVSHLPGNEEILVIEKYRQTYCHERISGCEGNVRFTDSSGWDERFLVSSYGRRGLTIRNLTQQQFDNVVVYYKTYYAPAGFYVGGITHSVRIDTIGQGEEVQLLPRPFISESSKVVLVTEEE